MSTKNIVGFYKNWILVEQDGVFYVTSRQPKKILFKGDEEGANKVFTMLIANFINEELTKVES